MDGIAAVTARVQQIQGLVQSMQTPVRSTVVPLTGAASLSVGTGSATTSGSTAGSAFDQVLAQARAAQTAPGAPGAPAGVAGAGAAATSSAVDADGVPLDLKDFGNGRVPASALQRLGVGEHTLWAPAAEGFTRMRAAAAADGVTIGVTDSYRSYDAQVDVARRKGLYRNGGLAAVPGTSDHGWGLSLDLRLDDRAQTWMRANAGRFGFEENTPREPWHWTFQP